MKPLALPRIILGTAVLFLNACASSPTSQNAAFQQGAYEPQADREGIRSIVARRLPDLRECYEKAIDERPGAEGRIVLEWEIDQQGNVKDLREKRVDPGIRGAATCVKAKVQAWKFPKPLAEEVVTVTYPFMFSERSGY